MHFLSIGGSFMQNKTENRLPLLLFPKQLINPRSEWYQFEHLMPWQELEDMMKPLFSDSGRNAIPVRQIIGALIIQAKKNLSDRETMIAIMETPMLQYFLGLDDFIHNPIFDFTLLCKYRQMIGIDIAKEMIETLLTKHKIIHTPVKDDVTHKGSMSIDASVVPVNITYPTDLKLLNQVREKTEEIIDVCHEQSDEKEKPRTYRIEARKTYLKYAKAKRLSKNKRFTANRQQLQYIQRNLKNIDERIEKGVYQLNEAHIEVLKVCKTINDQQYRMWETKTNRIDDRLVNLYQPHIRCIVRGKAGSPYEFGPKIAVSKVNGFIHLDEISFDNFNESKTIESLIDKYKRLHGVYPNIIRADKIYQTRTSKALCKELDIRLSGKPLGRPKKETNETNEQLMKEDFVKRLEIEGVFGVAKTKYGLSKLMTKLPESQKASIGLVFFVMNLCQILSFVRFSETLEMLILEIYFNETSYVYDDEG